MRVLVVVRLRDVLGCSVILVWGGLLSVFAFAFGFWCCARWCISARFRYIGASLLTLKITVWLRPTFRTCRLLCW